eukprot:539825-Rhodomonas_salina.1
MHTLVPTSTPAYHLAYHTSPTCSCGLTNSHCGPRRNGPQRHTPTVASHVPSPEQLAGQRAGASEGVQAGSVVRSTVACPASERAHVTWGMVTWERVTWGLWERVT